MPDSLRVALGESADTEMLELAAYLLDRFGLLGHRIEGDGTTGWDLDAHDVVEAIKDFASEKDLEEHQK